MILDQGVEEGDTKEPKKKEFKFDMKALKDDIDAFVSNAEDGLYYSPNRKASKAKRSKWRFEAKNYFKTLMEIPQDSEFYADGVKYLLKMFGIMCHANGVYTFQTEDHKTSTYLSIVP